MDELTQLLSDLVAIDSTNPDLVPGGAGEARVAQHVHDWLARAGLEVKLIEAAAGRPNVVAIARGSGGGRALLLNGHMDTVGSGNMQGPHAPVIKDGRLYGRGAYDMKGGLAACMSAIAAASKRGLRGDVIFTAVVDEENASIGQEAVASSIQADGAIVAEFTELQLIIAHKGFAWFEIETLGKAAHGSRPDLGVDAIVKMGGVLTRVEQLDKSLRSKPTHPLLGSGSVHASIIKGGREVSVYPDQCVLTIERRTLPSETMDDVEVELARILADCKRNDAKFEAVIRRGFGRSALETPGDSAIATVTQAAATKLRGRPAAVAGVPFWTDAALLKEAGIPAVLFGPSGAGAHADEEWVDLASVQACAEIYLQTAVDFCG